MALTQLFLAFDNLAEKPEETLADMHQLSESGEPFGIKFNLDAMLDPDVRLLDTVESIKGLGRLVFADLKMWNGSRTMESVVKTFVGLGVDFINMYVLADKQAEKAIRATEGSKTKILALTVLSHYDATYCRRWFNRNIAETVFDFSARAVEIGFHGILLPGTMLGEVTALPTIKVATGLRPEWYKDSRHEQEATPAEVVMGGAHFAVCGSPVLKQSTIEKKIAALRRILDEMRKVAT